MKVFVEAAVAQAAAEVATTALPAVSTQDPAQLALALVAWTHTCGAQPLAQPLAVTSVAIQTASFMNVVDETVVHVLDAALLVQVLELMMSVQVPAGVSAKQAFSVNTVASEQVPLTSLPAVSTQLWQEPHAVLAIEL